MKKLLLFAILLIFIATTSYCENETLVIKEINLEMVKCPAGSFMMGSSKEVKKDSNHLFAFGFYYSEKPHLISVSKPFYIGKYELTQYQYESIIGNNPSEFRNINNPVERVNWNEAKEYCTKLNQKYSNLIPNGYRFDLPTEAQWEYACRAGTNTNFNNGTDNKIDEVAWYWGNSQGGLYFSRPVGQKKPNAWGIYDMHGNIAEWCNDWYSEYSDNGLIPLGETYIHYRVLRGGNSQNNLINCSSTSRDYYSPDNCSPQIGFCVALVPID